MFVGEAPGADEDRLGEPFVGRAGQLLTKMIRAMGLERSDVYIGNILKCRPPDNRTPTIDEMAVCMPYILKQIEIIDPEIVCALGATALKGLLRDPGVSISRMRGKFVDWNGRKLMPTFHPSYLLRSPGEKEKVWEDLQQIMGVLGLKDPRKPA
jgi:DNA polymerase